MTKRVPKPGDIVYITPEELGFIDDGHIDTAAVVVRDEDGVLRYVFINDSRKATFNADDSAHDVSSSAEAWELETSDDSEWSWSQSEAIRKRVDLDEKWATEFLDRVKKAREFADRLEGKDSA